MTQDPTDTAPEATPEGVVSSDPGDTSTADERHPGTVTPADSPEDPIAQETAAEAGVELPDLPPEKDDTREAVAAFVVGWDDANLDEREQLLAALSANGGTDFVHTWRNSTVDQRAETMAGLREQLGLDKD